MEDRSWPSASLLLDPALFEELAGLGRLLAARGAVEAGLGAFAGGAALKVGKRDGFTCVSRWSCLSSFMVGIVNVGFTGSQGASGWILGTVA